MARKTSKLADILLIAVSVLVSLLLAEIAFRVLLPQHFDPHPRGMYRSDPAVGYVLAPNFRGTFKRAEFEHEVTSNNVGLRGPPVRARNQSTFRVVCLGDSFTWGYGVNDSETYPQRLESLLARKYPDVDIQVLNAGVPGYGTADALRFLQSRAVLLDPDLVVLQFLADNDFTENRRPALGRVSVRDGWLHADEPPRPQPMRTLDAIKRSSHLAAFLSERLGYLAVRAGWLAPAAAGGAITDGDAKRTQALLKQLAAEARKLDAPTLIVFSTGQAPVIHKEDAANRARQVVLSAAEQADARMLDLTPHLRSRPDRMRLYYPYDGHWTAVGDAAVAEILSEEIGRQFDAAIRAKGEGQLSSAR